MSEQTYTQTAQALGTTISISIVGSELAEVERSFTVIWQTVEQFENRFSRFIPESELTHFNVHAGEKVLVSGEFLAMLVAVKKLATQSNGYFNPFLLPALQKAGYVKSMVQYSADFSQLNYATRRVVSAGQIKTGKDWAQIPGNTALDFGGLGKGYLGDKLVMVLSETYKGFYLSMGGDVYASGKPSDKSSWGVQVQSVTDPALDCAHVSTKKRTYGVATSGLLRRTKAGEQRHIIDPHTLEPVAGNLSMCTVLAPTVLIADVMASSILIGGEDFARTLIKDKNIYGVILQFRDGTVLPLGTGFSLHKPDRLNSKIGAQ